MEAEVEVDIRVKFNAVACQVVHVSKACDLQVDRALCDPQLREPHDKRSHLPSP